ncbi:hypothetical protein VTL71DRAFT_11353 [Oculimacula yallundae]|uniref:Uncharacterized protein n=1 Tax=Oculimacula yallundae TaxID=86028 RepID=A0ABR4CQ92_9HELO
MFELLDLRIFEETRLGLALIGKPSASYPVTPGRSDRIFPRELGARLSALGSAVGLGFMAAWPSRPLGPLVVSILAFLIHTYVLIHISPILLVTQPYL